MKLHILSDLHLEFAPYRPMDTLPLAVDADAVVLAGDICPGVRGVQWARQAFADKPVIYVPGNHEAYGTVLPDLLADLRREAAGSNVHVLNNDELVLDGVRFLGTTLWTDFNVDGDAWQGMAMAHARRSMADFWSIYSGKDAPFTPYQSRELHLQARQWLELKLSEPFAGETVVVTHHGCSRHSIARRFHGNMLNPAFTSDLEFLLGRCALWVHGHTHDSFDYELEGTRVIVNPRGYCKSNYHETRPHGAPVVEKCENRNFNNNLVVEI